MNILHIAAHLGGGAGKAISGITLLGQKYFPDTHRVLLLQPPEKSGYVQACQDGGVDVFLWDGRYDQLSWADVVVVSWWNHPSMARFLHELPPLSAALVLWSHVNGCHYPYLPFQLANTFDMTLVTSPYSLENPTWTEEQRSMIKKRARIVYGMGAFYPENFLPKTDYQNQVNFTVGYVGTLNYGKLHPEFVTFCQEVCKRVPNVRFVMVGDHDRQLEHDVHTAGLTGCFSFPGFVSDVPALMRTFDVFGYLLNPDHYGTTENVLLEAMASGIPVAALRQNVEQYIIPETVGYLVENAQQYGEALACLSRDPAQRELLGHCGREYVQQTFNAEKNAAVFHESCQAAMNCSQKRSRFSFLGETPWQWFLFCAGDENKKLFEEAHALCRIELPESQARVHKLLHSCPPIFREERKSSLRHFAAMYPEDPNLQVLSSRMED